MSARLYTAHLAPGRPADRTDLIDDRWRWGPLLFPLLWALWHRHWIIVLALLAIGGGLGWLAMAGYGPVAAVVEGAVRLWLALEGGEMARLDRSLRGWRELGAVSAEADDEAALRWFRVTA